MLILALESATISVGVSVVDETGVLASKNVLPGRLQTETLHPLIREIMNQSGVTMTDLDAIVVDIGPGLFTGLRVGISTAKTLAFALDIPIVGCTSTATLIAAAPQGRPTVAIIDVRRSEVVYADGDAPNDLHLTTPLKCAEMLRADDKLIGAALVGDGVPRHAEVFASVIAERSLEVVEEERSPDAGSLGLLGLRALERGEGVPAVELTPLYLREADAKINWSARDLSKVDNR